MYIDYLLKQEVKGGKSKQLQLDDFKRYFDFEKAGQKFIITDIYDEPLTKEDKKLTIPMIFSCLVTCELVIGKNAYLEKKWKNY